ncbi:hypothetical protein IFM89_030862 [Coptis chinensis]|uniref:THIF-type NAD/FAD binding fold domain-containing protein n=1 Tax=Coptis chinensis TaxID=261450 RepID=A0A835GZ53_9MAGN|nr:hypothetical protein IFM89_030862 [Coptis chinensis]
METRGGVADIVEEIEKLEAEKSKIEKRISSLQAQLLGNKNEQEKEEEEEGNNNNYENEYGLSPDMIYRYSRHLLLPSFGVQAQSKLFKSSILVVGAGGLGSPALLYLAASGVGRLGIVDNDVVELNNLHRQIIHAEAYIGQSKVKSAAAACQAARTHIVDLLFYFNTATQGVDHAHEMFAVGNDPLKKIVLGSRKTTFFKGLAEPLISGAAVGLEGQLTVYNYNGGPCYRCLFPSPPPATACQRCSDSGVLGVGKTRYLRLLLNFSSFFGLLFLVPGVIGCLQALEAIKVASSVGEPLSGRMLLFDALSGRIRIRFFRFVFGGVGMVNLGDRRKEIVKIRGRCSQCEVCGEHATFTQQPFLNFNYESFTQTPFATLPKHCFRRKRGEKGGKEAPRVRCFLISLAPLFSGICVLLSVEDVDDGLMVVMIMIWRKMIVISMSSLLL